MMQFLISLLSPLGEHCVGRLTFIYRASFAQLVFRLTSRHIPGH